MPTRDETVVITQYKRVGRMRHPKPVPVVIIQKDGALNLRNAAWKNYGLPELTGDASDEPLLMLTRMRFKHDTKEFRHQRKLRMNIHRAEAHCHKADWLRRYADFTGDECILFPSMAPGRPERVKYNYQPMAAARALLLMTQGLPKHDDALATHKCGNGHLSCVNPKHLRWGSRGDNAKEAVLHGSPSEFIAGMDPAVVSEVRASPKLVKVLALEYDLPAGVVSAIRNGEAWASA